MVLDMASIVASIFSSTLATSRNNSSNRASRASAHLLISTGKPFRELRRRFKRTVLRTSEGEFRFETDTTALHELDDAGLLQLDEIFHYEPVATAA
jgi:hypothetical protein